jgi:hypothetical protein
VRIDDVAHNLNLNYSHFGVLISSEIGHKSSNVLGLKKLLGQNIEAEVHVNFLGLIQSNTGPIWISLHLYRIYTTIRVYVQFLTNFRPYRLIMNYLPKET